MLEALYLTPYHASVWTFDTFTLIILMSGQLLFVNYFKTAKMDMENIKQSIKPCAFKVVVSISQHTYNT